MATPEHNPKSLPTGVVTLLFTDIAGSSRLWEQHGDGFIPVWQSHDALMRDAIARFNGYEVKSEGDAFMIAFSDPNQALQCALYAQAALARYPWPRDIEPPRVRMGLHTGDPFVHGNDYFGPTVNRAAHICAAAHGGQVLLSRETRLALDAGLAQEMELTDLGDFRLKDMGTPQRLFQARYPSGEPRAFPPPRTLEGQPNNLPLQRTSFVGRADEIEQVAAFLAQGEKPVLTLTGPGGIGKTRLSLQAAAARAEWFPDGVWYVKLVDAKDVVGAAVEIASAMNIPLDPAQPALPQVRDWLAHRHCLLILDEANAIPQAASLIRELLSGATNLRCLATARESLQIAESDDLPVSGLPVEPEPSQTATEAQTVPPDALTSDAERLFLERALLANPFLKLTPTEVAAVRALVRKLEGVPNSIERAAQLMKSLTPSALLAYLEQEMPSESVRVRSGVEKFKGILRRSAQKAVDMSEEAHRASAESLGRLLHGIAEVATDRRDQKQATELSRESLRLSQEAGDPLGVAAALWQLARLKWQQGDRQSAAALMGVVVREYRLHDAEEYAQAARELETMQEDLERTEGYLPVTPSVENAVKMAMDE